MLSLDPKELPQPKLHQYLLGAIGPRPIAFASTIDQEGRANLAPYSFFNVFSSNPPILIFSPARRGRDNTTKHTLENAIAHRECVINIVNYDMVEQMSLASTEYPAGVSEFEKTGLTPIASDVVKPFRVKEAPVQFECKINDVVALGTQGGAGNLVICEVVRIHVAESILDEEGRISPIKMDQVARMGGHWYTRANKGLFQLPQPMTQIGIGFDALPADIKTSTILTGNELAQLAGVESLPNETEVNEYKLTELADLFMEFEGKAAELEVELHKKAKALLQDKKVTDAWMTLLSFNN
ncbi:MAG: flavin reductase family protein [Flavobacteriales bacterium]|jgi:flavin reductase (DIM6/NTAB) family NADH-FMN oxidoreductase RutF